MQARCFFHEETSDVVRWLRFTLRLLQPHTNRTDSCRRKGDSAHLTFSQQPHLSKARKKRPPLFPLLDFAFALPFSLPSLLVTKANCEKSCQFNTTACPHLLSACKGVVELMMMMMMIHLSESRSINAHVVDSRPHWGVVGGSRLCALTAARGKKRTGGSRPR